MKKRTLGLAIILLAITIARGADAANTTGFAWSENIGWIDASGVTVSDTDLSGYLYSGNIGWISLHCDNTDSCGTVDYGVTNNEGVLDGFAWSENIGWIDMSEVAIDKDTGVFSGYAYSGNIGWISFNCSNTNSCGDVDYKVTTDWTVQTPVPTTTTRRSGGSTLQSRIDNLEKSGNTDRADELRQQFGETLETPQLDLHALVELLISLGIITGDNIERARQLTTPPPGATPTFTRDLDLNAEGDDVRQLQQYLINNGYSIPAGATGFFGSQTQSALIQFQLDNNISPAVGYFGPITRGMVR